MSYYTPTPEHLARLGYLPAPLANLWGGHCLAYVHTVTSPMPAALLIHVNQSSGRVSLSRRLGSVEELAGSTHILRWWLMPTAQFLEQLLAAVGWPVSPEDEREKYPSAF